MGDLTLQHVVLRIVAVVLIASVHGFTIAATAVAMGDAGPRQDDRLSIAPWQHLDPIGGLLLMFFTLGWIRPIAINPDRLRPGPVGLLAVVLGSSCATLALAVVARSVRPVVLNMLPDTLAATFFVFVDTLGNLCVSFTLFNLLPLPMLTGQHLLLAALPRQLGTIRRAQPYVAVLLALLIVTDTMARLLAPAQAAVASVVLGG
jgi:Zn-dependent protease